MKSRQIEELEIKTKVTEIYKENKLQERGNNIDVTVKDRNPSNVDIVR